MKFSYLAYLFIAFAWSRAILRFRDKTISFFEFLFWSSLWISAIFVVTYPAYTNELSSRLGIGRGADVIVYMAVGLLTYLSFRMYVKIDTLDREITRLVRAMAIKENDKKL